MKALGTGARGVAWREIEVLPNRRGKPLVYLHGRAKETGGGDRPDRPRREHEPQPAVRRGLRRRPVAGAGARREGWRERFVALLRERGRLT